MMCYLMYCIELCINSLKGLQNQELYPFCVLICIVIVVFSVGTKDNNIRCSPGMYR